MTSVATKTETGHNIENDKTRKGNGEGSDNLMSSSSSRKEQNEEEEIPDVRPIKYGSACPPTLNQQQQQHEFKGRCGVWHCENCDKAKLLPPGTKQWKCPHCQKMMYTLPKDKCPLDTFCPCCCWDTILTRN